MMNESYYDHPELEDPATICEGSGQIQPSGGRCTVCGRAVGGRDNVPFGMIRNRHYPKAQS